MYNNYIEAVAAANLDQYMEAIKVHAALKAMNKDERKKIMEKADRFIIDLGLDKKWEAAIEEERRAKEVAIKEERRAKEEERRAKEEINKLLEKIKELESRGIKWFLRDEA